MAVYFLVLLFALIPHDVEARQEWKHERFSNFATMETLSWRILNMSKSTYHDVSQRITTLNPIRFSYELSPHYEQGYVFHEIIERYKKMVENYRKAALTGSMDVFDTMEKVEFAQKLYLEMYHFVMMMHEIPQKYVAAGGEYKDLYILEIEKAKQERSRMLLKNAEKLKAEAAKLQIVIQQQAKKEKKVSASHAAAKGLELKELFANTDPATLAKLFPKRWKFDYGWEPADWE